jgi:hypothetical protein
VDLVYVACTELISGAVQGHAGVYSSIAIQLARQRDGVPA